MDLAVRSLRMLGHQDFRKFDIFHVIHTAGPSTSETNMDVSEDIREESEDEVDQSCPDDLERLNQQHPLLCGDVQNKNVSFPIFVFIHLSVIRLRLIKLSCPLCILLD